MARITGAIYLYSTHSHNRRPFNAANFDTKEATIYGGCFSQLGVGG